MKAICSPLSSGFLGFVRHSAQPRLLVKKALLVLMLAAAVLWAASPVFGASRDWTGAVSANWSDPNNWRPVGTPQNGDQLTFGSVSDANRSMVNDLPDVQLQVLNFSQNDYQLNGNAVTITEEVDNWFSAQSRTITINCPLIFPNGGEIATGGLSDSLFIETTGDLYLNGPITVLTGVLALRAKSGDFQAGDNGHLYISGVISGAGDIWATAEYVNGHVSSVEFNGTPGNTFSGSLYLNAIAPAQIAFNKSSGAVVTNRMVVKFGESANLHLAGPNQIGNNAIIEIDGGSQLLLSGYEVAVGSLVFTNFHADAKPSTLDTGGTLVRIANGIIASVDNDHVHPTIKGQLVLMGVPHPDLTSLAQFEVSGGPEPGLEIQASVDGNGFQKNGPGTLRLNGINTFVGAVVAGEGTIEALTSSAFGQAGPTFGVVLWGGNITLNNVDIGNERLFVSSSNSLFSAINQCSWAGPVILETRFNIVPLDPTFSLTRTMDFYGKIIGAGGLNLLPAVLGVGSVRLLGSEGNTFTGPTIVGCSLLQLGKPSGVNAYAGPLIVGNPGGRAICEARWFNQYQNVGATATLYANGVINLNNHNEDFGPVTFNGGEVDTGTGSFNIYAPLTVNPASSSAVINGYLGLPPSDNRIFIVGDGAADCDLLVNAVVFGSPGGYFVKQGAGTMCLANANTFDAPTLLEEGILDVSSDGGLGTWPGLVVFGGATLRLSGSGTGGGFEGIGPGVGGTHGLIEVPPNASWTFAGGVLLDGPITLNVGESGGLAFGGAISSSGPGCSVTKTGPGTLVFSGSANNTYSGDTIINSGGFYLSKSANVLSVPGNLMIGPGPVGPTTFARLLQNGGIGGSVTVNANSLLDLNNNNLTLSQLNLRDGGSLWTSGGNLSFPSGSVINVGSQSVFGSHAASTISGFLSLPFVGAATFNVSPAAPTPPLLFGPELEVTAAISGGVNHGNSGTLIKEGLGQMRLSGNSTFSGNVNINAGRLIAAHPNALGGTFLGTAVNNGAQLILEGGINVAGEYITLDSTNSPALESRGGVNTSGGILYLSRNSDIGPTSPADGLVVSGQIDGPGALIKVGSGILTLSGGTGNTYAGETFVNQGTLLLNKPFTVTAIPGILNIGTTAGAAAVARNLNGYQIIGSIFVNRNGLYDVNGQEENVDHVWLSEGGDVQTGANPGALYLKTGGSIRVIPGAINDSSVISGNLGLDPGQHDIVVARGNFPGTRELVINALVSQPVGTAGIQKSGDGTLRLTANNTYAGLTVVNGGTLQVDGSQPQSDVQINGATLQGNGTAGIISFTGSGGVIAPGASPGVLSCQGLANGGGTGTLEVELNGPSPGSGYDQLNVLGNGFAVNLAGISLKTSLGYQSSVGNRFTILANNNESVLRIAGTFTGLPQGKKFYIGQELFQINYRGGDGNDVVLTRLTTPPPPQLTIQRASSNSVRLLWATNDPPFSLQAATNLTSWLPVSSSPVVVGTNEVVTDAAVGAWKFYRLTD